jgi:hypothetical protein
MDALVAALMVLFGGLRLILMLICRERKILLNGWLISISEHDY